METNNLPELCFSEILDHLLKGPMRRKIVLRWQSRSHCACHTCVINYSQTDWSNQKCVCAVIKEIVNRGAPLTICCYGRMREFGGAVKEENFDSGTREYINSPLSGYRWPFCSFLVSFNPWLKWTSDSLCHLRKGDRGQTQGERARERISWEGESS